jgi:type-F conjugative transfer system pilin assembly protein TrbC
MLLKSDSLMRSLMALLAVSALTLPATSFAEDSARPPVQYGKLDGVSSSDKAAADARARDAVASIMEAYNTKRTPEMERVAQRAKTTADAIADEAMAADRDKILDFLGIDPKAQTGLYYFVSWSMPLEVLRSYAIEAMWSGGTLVFKGVPPKHDLGKFLVNDLRQLVYGKGAAANISIDPRLYDAYAVTTAPTIVFTTTKADFQCQGIRPTAIEGTDATYDRCPELDPSTYWKVSGNVTSNYALETFIEHGALTAKPYLVALAKGFSTGATPGKTQRAFEGSWDDVLSPSHQKAAQDAAKQMLSAPSQSH